VVVKIFICFFIFHTKFVHKEIQPYFFHIKIKQFTLLDQSFFLVNRNLLEKETPLSIENYLKFNSFIKSIPYF